MASNTGTGRPRQPDPFLDTPRPRVGVHPTGVAKEDGCSNAIRPR